MNYDTFTEENRNEDSDHPNFEYWYCDGETNDGDTSPDWKGKGWYRFTDDAGSNIIFHLYYDLFNSFN